MGIKINMFISEFSTNKTHVVGTRRGAPNEYP